MTVTGMKILMDAPRSRLHNAASRLAWAFVAKVGFRMTGLLSLRGPLSTRSSRSVQRIYASQLAIGREGVGLSPP